VKSAGSPLGNDDRGPDGHVAMVSHPDDVVALIEAAVQGVVPVPA
jgi:hypothetical protein